MRKFIRTGLLSLAFLATAVVSPALAVQPVKSYSSGNVANASAVATIPAGANQFGYLTGFEITAGGATAGACVNPTITGLVGGTVTYTFCAPTGATAGAAKLDIQFVPPLTGSALNTAIVLTLPALGAGNTNATVVIHGYSE